MRLPALEIQQPNVPGIMLAQQQYRLGEAELAKQGREAKREETISGLRSDVVAGKQGAAEMLASIDPKALEEVTGALTGWDDRKRETSKRHIKSAMRILGDIMQTPQEGRSMAWQQGLAQAQKEGIDISLLPGISEQDVSPNFIPGMAEKLGLKLGAAWEELQEEKTAQPTGPMKDAEALGLKPGTAEYNAYIRERTLSKDKDATKWSEPKFDKGVGKWYQENLETGKRDYESVPTGMEITAGGATVRTGVPMQKKTAASLEDKVIAATNGLTRVRGIKSSFRPEYQTVATRWNALKTALQEKAEGIPALEWVGKQFGEGDRQLLRDFTVYKRRAIENLNLYIKEITGAQLSKDEAKRLTRGMPNPGKGLLDGDSPTEFYAKLLDIERATKKATARYVYALRNGLEPLAMNLDDIEGIMAERWGDVFRSLPKDQDEMMRQAEADRIVAEEFGLGL